MDISFQSPLQPGIFLSLDAALSKNGPETVSALMCAVCDTILARHLLPSRSLSLSLKYIKIKASEFRSVLESINFNWRLTVKEEMVFQDACNGLYSNDDLEGAFYKYGKYNGIIALILFFRQSQNIQRQWSLIRPEFREWLVKEVAKMLSPEIVVWIAEFIEKRNQCNAHPLQYLGKHAGRKRKRGVSNTMFQQFQEWSRPSTEPEPPQQQPSNHQTNTMSHTQGSSSLSLEYLQTHQPSSQAELSFTATRTCESPFEGSSDISRQCQRLPPISTISSSSQDIPLQNRQLPISTLTTSSADDETPYDVNQRQRICRPEKNLPWVAHRSHHASREYMLEQRTLSQAPKQYQVSTSNDLLLSSQLPTIDRAREPISDISSNATNIHDVDEQQRTGESISDTLRSAGISTISALLNHDSNTPATTFPTAVQGTPTDLPRTIYQSSTLERIPGIIPINQ